MILLGLFAGIVVGQIQAKLYKQDPNHVVNIAMLGTVLGIIGARLYHVLDQQEWPRYRENLGDIFAIWNGGIGIFGAFEPQPGAQKPPKYKKKHMDNSNKSKMTMATTPKKQ